MSRPGSDRIEVRTSEIHGKGVYATRMIRKGTRVIEYVGERITQEEAALRYDDEGVDRPHVVLFTLDDDWVLDAGVGGNDARFINHSCEPNCQAVDDDGRIFIYSLKTIREGDELTYDYLMQRPGYDFDEIRDRYPCFCGAPTCRGTMLEPPRRRKRRR